MIFKGINKPPFHYQVSFVVHDIQHDDNDGDGDEVRHEMARRLYVDVGLSGRRRQRIAFCCLVFSARCTEHRRRCTDIPTHPSFKFGSKVCPYWTALSKYWHPIFWLNYFAEFKTNKFGIQIYCRLQPQVIELHVFYLRDILVEKHQVPGW